MHTGPDCTTGHGHLFACSLHVKQRYLQWWSQVASFGEQPLHERPTRAATWGRYSRREIVW